MRNTKDSCRATRERRTLRELKDTLIAAIGRMSDEKSELDRQWSVAAEPRLCYLRLALDKYEALLRTIKPLGYNEAMAAMLMHKAKIFRALTVPPPVGGVDEASAYQRAVRKLYGQACLLLDGFSRNELKNDLIK